jgi:hypothetical protein
VKTLYQKLIKIDILLSHVKLQKMSIITHTSEQKKLSKKYKYKKIRENGSVESKTDQNRENRNPIF